ncbi:MAG: DUF1552 domain-containing protein [Phycisphaerales bacterium]|nr:DUF1552 domain-containing protein [Phycisphaerales bacterium]
MSLPPLDRRTMMRGMGTALALPWLDAMAAPASAAELASPTRAAFLFIPNGVHRSDWAPTGSGGSTVLPNMLEPLSPLKNRLTVLTGLDHNNAKALGDGPGDHARSSAAFLTGAHPVKTAGDDISVGVSVDQVAARHLERATRFGSLQLGCEPALTSGSCDSGYSCAYSANISWRKADTPMAKEINPRRLFERLFSMGPTGETKAARAQRLASRRSVLDFVRRDARRLHARVGVGDRDRLDDYMDGVRDLERRIEQVEQVEQAPSDLAGFEPPSGIPGQYREHLRLMNELIILAWRLDLTRVVTFMWANEGSNRAYRNLGIAEGHHHLSHHGGEASMVDQIRAINRFQMEEFAYFLSRLQDTPDGGGSLLDNAMVLFGGAIGDGNRHNHDDLPIVLAGDGGGLEHSGHMRAPKGTPLCNLHLSLLDRLGVPAETFGDSTGRLSGI